MLLRIGAAVRRALERLGERLPYFPDPKATCPAHGARYCRPCRRNPGNCAHATEVGGCGYWFATGMHWDTCPNRIRGGKR